MLLVMNQLNIKKHAGELFSLDDSQVKELLDTLKEAYDGLYPGQLKNTFGRHYHQSHLIAHWLGQFNDIIGGYGVEGFTDPVDVQYVNLGDTYKPTILYFDGKFRIGDWGSIVEQYS